MISEHYDVIIIGTGAGGGTLLHRLAQTGKRILVIERGSFLPRERENWDEKAVHKDQRYLAKETWYDANDQPFSPYTHYWVGGNTKVYGAALLRMREHDFREVRHFGGISPAWPIRYDTFEPYYTRAEHMYHAHGERGLDPTEPRCSAPLPYPAIPHEKSIAALCDDLKANGCHPFPAPIGVRLNERSNKAPYRLSSFDGYPDLTEIKADSEVVGVLPALKHTNVTLMTEALAERLITDASGREIKAVQILQHGERFTASGSLVVVSCGAINSAALLLRSANDRHPRGLANSSGLVGRNYMCHHNSLLIAVYEQTNDAQFQKTFAITDYYRRGSDSEFPLGTIQLMGKPDRWTLEFLVKEQLQDVPLENVVGHTIDFFLTAEDLPDPSNRVTLREDGSIKLTRTENNLGAHERLERTAMDLLSRVESRHGRKPPRFLRFRLGILGVSHQCGTLRFGSDPLKSVLDLNCRAHDVRNLYVVDGSFFPSSSAVNPSLTIMANALRVGDHLSTLLH